MKKFYVVTSKLNNKKWELLSLTRRDHVQSDINIHINSDKKYQKMIGFGGAFTEASAYTLSQISKENRKKVIEAYFNRETGLNYGLGRVHIHSCDFALENYTYVEENDKELKTFNIERDFKWVIPFVKDAGEERGEKIQLLASPWSPPAWMKSNQDMNHGGKLLPEYYDSWANYYVKFIKEYQKAGLDIYSITIQNEPAATQVWDSCLYTGEEERDFLKNHLGPALKKAGLEDIKVLIWDHNRDLMVERAKAVLEDEEASQYVWGTAFHWYGEELFDEVRKVHELFPEKHLLFTEGCEEGGCKVGAWHTGERYARNMIGDINNYCEGYIDWNLCLDETGGPNHVKNLCDAPIIIDTQKDEVIYNSSYYYIGHFSRFIEPGAYRIDCQISDDRLMATAFENPNKEIVIIVLNQSDETIKYTINQNYSIESIPHSIHTIVLPKEEV